MNDLIDTTEMYLRTILDLEEEGVVPLRARIAERLHQSGPTVSQTVARMERDGLLHVSDDRHLELTDAGRHRAVSVMRKHRLAELLLVNVIGLEYELAHLEACRWEHVMSDNVERKVYQLLGKPTVSPYGNPIPGLDEIDDQAPKSDPSPAISLQAVTGDDLLVVRRISEQLQNDPEPMAAITAAGIAPGARITVTRIDTDVEITHEDRRVRLSEELSALIFVSTAPVAVGATNA